MSNDIEDLEAELEGGDDKKAIRLSPAQWQQIKRLWEYGDHTLAEIADQFNIRADTIQRRLKDDKVQKGSRAHEATAVVEGAMEDEVAKQVAESVKRINETRNDHYRFAEAIAKMTMQELIDAKKNGQAFSTKDGNLGALNKAAKTLETLRKERWVILGLDLEDGDPEDMDELLITELSQEQISSMQAEMRGITYSNPLDELDDINEETDRNFVEETGED